MNRTFHPLFGVILAAYLAIGGLYAALTPAWQAPDEPAHYNYIKALVETGRFPVLVQGCYDQAYLAEIISSRFPPHLSVAGICYEYHQPPLYYLLAAPIFAVSYGSLLAARLVSVLWGGVLLWLTYRLAQTIFPDRPFLSLGATAFVAFVPMHTAMLASANNDALAEVLLTALLLLLARHLLRAEAPARRDLAFAGLILGLGLVTKTTVYIGLPLVAVALWLRERNPVAWLKQAGLVYAPALAVALPWYLRNALVYGGLDVLGLARHDAVVEGQLRTAEHIAQIGLWPYLDSFVRVTFRSFWGQFGWMAVPIDPRLYLALTLVFLLALAGLGAWTWRARREPGLISARQQQALGLAGLTIAFIAAGYLWYNSQFVQFQGRYFFTAIAPLGLFFTLGLGEALRRRRAAWAMIGLVALTLWIAGSSLLAGDINGWGVLIAGAFGALLAIQRWLPGRADGWLAVAFYLGLVGLSAASPFLFVVPNLSP